MAYEQYSKENEEFWEKEKQIKFSIPSEDDVEELKKYIIQEFFPDEPICKNCGLDNAANGGWFQRKLLEWTFIEMVDDPVTKYKHSPGCIVAKSTISGNIVGARLGTVVSRNDAVKNERFDWMANLPLCLPVPHCLTFSSNLGPLFEKLRFGPQYMFEDLENANTIYKCLILSVGREARGKGLGTELMKRSYELAKQGGCEYSHIGASSNGTQQIVSKLGNSQIVSEIKYDDIREDNKGRPFFVDTGANQSIRIINVDHRNFN